MDSSHGVALISTCPDGYKYEDGVGVKLSSRINYVDVPLAERLAGLTTQDIESPPEENNSELTKTK